VSTGRGEPMINLDLGRYSNYGSWTLNSAQNGFTINEYVIDGRTYGNETDGQKQLHIFIERSMV
jgi:hypothetical protein